MESRNLSAQVGWCARTTREMENTKPFRSPSPSQPFSFSPPSFIPGSFCNQSEYVFPHTTTSISNNTCYDIYDEDRHQLTGVISELSNTSTPTSDSQLNRQHGVRSRRAFITKVTLYCSAVANDTPTVRRRLTSTSSLSATSIPGSRPPPAVSITTSPLHSDEKP